MKKTKIIIPALAVLCFSTMAAVSGTVAWFTSTTATTVTTTNFNVTGLDGDLSVTASGGVGTTVVDGTNQITAESTGTGDDKVVANLTHGSVDFTSLKVFSLDQEEDNTSSNHYITRGTLFGTDANTKFLENSSTLQYNVFTWTYTFKFGSGSTYSGSNRNLFFDPTTTISNTSGVSGLQDTDLNTSRAFRMLFVATQGDTTKKMVWSPNQALSCLPQGDGTVYYNSYVADGTSAATVKQYESSEIICPDNSETKVASGASGSTSLKSYLGTFSSSANTITVNCACWYEGTDPNIVNDSVKPAISVNLGFYVRTVK